MKRKLCSGSVECKSNCLYCFAKWKDIYPKCLEFESLEFESNAGTASIIYPCCDSEFFLQEINIDRLESELSSLEKVYISISTKSHIDDNKIDKLVELDNQLKKNNKGFVKVGVSITTKNRINELEFNTLSYKNRVELLKNLLSSGLSTNVVLKPILPFIDINEYFEIIDDLAFIEKFLTGDLYINLESDFYKKYILNRYKVNMRQISWLEQERSWYVIENKIKKSKICDYIYKNGCIAYNSDIEIIKSYID